MAFISGVVLSENAHRAAFQINETVCSQFGGGGGDGTNGSGKPVLV
jgi:hypothetical protein